MKMHLSFFQEDKILPPACFGQNKLLETLKRCAFPTDNGIRWK